MSGSSSDLISWPLVGGGVGPLGVHALVFSRQASDAGQVQSCIDVSRSLRPGWSPRARNAGASTCLAHTAQVVASPASQGGRL